ncbi:MAG: FAD-binding oxidoreductase [Gammaproteobacteria bacterium]
MKKPFKSGPDFDLYRRTLLAALGGVALGARVPQLLAAGTGQKIVAGEAELTQRFGTSASVRGSANYEVWRQSMIWQRRKSPRYPEAIVQATSVADVVAAVKHAKKYGLQLTTRCGGHSMSASFLRDRGMPLDVGQLQGIEIDAAKKQARIGPGVIARGLSERLREVGLAFPTSHCGMVPLSGFLLGGGLGLNGNGWGGMSVFNVLAAEVVTADGEVRNVSPTENPDLYWAVRGGGPGLFAVVTRLDLQAYDLPKAIVGTTLSFRFSDMAEVADALAQIGPKTDRNVELLGYAGRAPEGLRDKLTPADSNIAMHLHANAYSGSVSEGRRMARHLLEHPIAKRAIARNLGAPKTIEELYFEEELGFSQRRWQGDNIYTNRLRDVVEVLHARMPACPAADSQAVFLYKGVSKMPDAACSTMGDFYAAFYTIWDSSTADGPILDYLAALYGELAPLGTGSNINEMNQEGRREGIAQCYTADAWKRLAELRAKWDPQHVFHDFYGLS